MSKERMEIDDGPQFARGAITKIKLRNFMTYTDTELVPGPNLNMILGPNGTGKSAVVCSIIIGLAGEINLTGRGASASDFVKKDTDWGSTEIELFNDRGTNYNVRRKISITSRTEDKIEHKSEWKIDKKACKKSDVLNLTQKLNIKVDNLCQFLPQDSVTQFVKMNSKELLLNTLKAAGDNQLVVDLQKLIEFSKDVQIKRAALDSLQKSCQEHADNALRLETEVHKLRHRQKLVRQKECYSQKIHYVRYLDSETKLRSIRSQYIKLEQDLHDIKKNSEPYQHAVDFHKSEETRVRGAVAKFDAQLRGISNLIQATQNDIENRKLNCQEEFAKYRGRQDEENNRENSIRLKQRELESHECKLSECRDVDYTRQIEELSGEVKDKRKSMIEMNQMKTKLADEINSLTAKLNQVKIEMQQIEMVRERKINLLKNSSPPAYRVLEWLAKNQDKFQKTVFLPMMCEINVKDPKYNMIVEKAISQHEILSFVCQTDIDVKTFTRCVRDELNLRFNVILAPDTTVEELENMSSAQKSNESLKNMPLKYLKDLIDAPEPIMRYLCGSREFHRIPVLDYADESQLLLLREHFTKFYVGNQFNCSSKSRHDGSLMLVTDFVRGARYLIHSLDTKRLKECRESQDKLDLEKKTAKQRQTDTHEEYQKLSTVWNDLATKLKQFQHKQEEKKNLEALIEIKQKEIARLQEEKIDLAAEREKLQNSVDKINQHILQYLSKLADSCAEFARLKELQMINLLICKVAERNYKLSRKQLADAKEDTSRLEEELKAKSSAVQKAERDLKIFEQVAEEKVTGFENKRLDKKTKKKFNEIVGDTIETLQLHKEELHAQIQRIYHDQNNNILEEYNRQNDALNDKRSQIEKLQQAIQEAESGRGTIKESWLSRLEEVIKVIDKNYREFMRKMRYDGQVKLDYDPSDPDKFDAYGIAILVKYRDNEQLIPLSSTRQSGGERSVATMVYMLALQAKTTVPFRCVDEINQGMDKENERKVFELLVKTADSSSSQYFLVSPKLLPNLPYSEKMKIHIVFNGPYMKFAWNKVKSN